MSASDVRAGGAFVEIFTKDSRLHAGLKAAEVRLSSFATYVSNHGKSLWAATVSGGGVIGAVYAATKAFAETGDHLNDVTQRTGLTSQALVELGYAAEQTGASMESIEKGVTKMNVLLAGADHGSKKALDAIRGLGLSFDDLKGLAPDEQFRAFAEAISQIDDPANRVAAAMKVFGKGAVALLPMLSSGAAGIDAFRQASRDLGNSFDSADIGSADKLGDLFADLRTASRALAFEFGAVMSGAITTLVELLTKAIAATTHFLRENKQLVVWTVAAASSAGVLAASVLAAGVACQGVAFVLGGLKLGLAAVVPAIISVASAAAWLTTIFNPVTALIAVIVGALAIAANELGAFDAAAAALGPTFSEVAGRVMLAWKLISTAVGTGDLLFAARLAFTIFGGEIHAVFANVYEFVTARMSALINSLSILSQVGQSYLRQILPADVVGQFDLAAMAIQGMGTAIASTLSVYGQIILSVGRWVSDGFSNIVGDVTSAWGGIVAALSSGDLASAAQIAFLLLTVEFERAKAALADIWDSTVGLLIDGWIVGTGLIGSAFTDVIATLESNWIDFVQVLTRVWEGFSSSFADTWKWLQTQTADAILLAMSQVDSTVDYESAKATLHEDADRTKQKTQKDREANRKTREDGFAEQRDGMSDRWKAGKEDWQKRTDDAVSAREKARAERAAAAQKKIDDAKRELEKAASDAQAAKDKQDTKIKPKVEAAKKAATEASTNRFAEVQDIREGGLKSVLDAISGDTREQTLADIKDLMQQSVDLQSETKDAIEDAEGLAGEALP
jgi:hypothetical protein